MTTRSKGDKAVRHGRLRMMTDPTGSSSPWPPGAIADWLPLADARTVEHILRTLGHTGAVSILGVVSQQGPISRPHLVELSQVADPIVRARLRELSDIGLLVYHRRHGPSVATWELNHDAMIRVGAYFLRPTPPQLTADQTPDSGPQAPAADPAS